MRFRLLGLLAAILTASPAVANTWSDCAGDTGGDLVNITKYNLVCLDCTEAAGDDDCVDSRLFFVGATTALICFDPDVALSEGVDAAQINVRYCPDGIKPAANPEYTCGKMTDTVLTGIQGSAGTQDSCLRVGPGAYYIEFVDDGFAADQPRVTIKGEGSR